MINLKKVIFSSKKARSAVTLTFLADGFIRCFTVDTAGNEITTRIFSAPDFINDYQSFFKQKPTLENYEAITDCRVKTLDLKNAQYCFHELPEFREWGRMMLTMNYVRLHQHFLSMHKETAEERYLKLLEQKAEIIHWNGDHRCRSIWHLPIFLDTRFCTRYYRIFTCGNYSEVGTEGLRACLMLLIFSMIPM